MSLTVLAIALICTFGIICFILLLIISAYCTRRIRRRYQQKLLVLVTPKDSSDRSDYAVFDGAYVELKRYRRFDNEPRDAMQSQSSGDIARTFDNPAYIGIIPTLQIQPAYSDHNLEHDSGDSTLKVNFSVSDQSLNMENNALDLSNGHMPASNFSVSQYLPHDDIAVQLDRNQRLISQKRASSVQNFSDILARTVPEQKLTAGMAEAIALARVDESMISFSMVENIDTISQPLKGLPCSIARDDYAVPLPVTNYDSGASARVVYSQRSFV